MEYNFMKFTEVITQKLCKKLGKEYQVEQKDISGINGTVKHSLMLIQKGKDIHPCINLDTYYSQYKAGKEMDSLVEAILESCSEESPVRLSSVLNFTDWENVKPFIYAKLVNREKNRLLLQDVPNRTYLDLSLVYYVRLESVLNEKYAAVQINNEYMGYWEIDEDMLYQSAWENIINSNEAVVDNIADILKPFLCRGENQKADGTEDIQIYVLSNKYHINGAVQMCNPKALRKVAETIGDDLWVLPSSVHEIILIPVCQTKDCAAGLAEIVKEMNDTQLERQEILSYHIYHYSRESGKVTIAI